MFWKFWKTQFFHNHKLLLSICSPYIKQSLQKKKKKFEAILQENLKNKFAYCAFLGLFRPINHKKRIKNWRRKKFLKTFQQSSLKKSSKTKTLNQWRTFSKDFENFSTLIHILPKVESHQINSSNHNETII